MTKTNVSADDLDGLQPKKNGTPTLPPVGSVWRDAETGMIRVIHSHSEDGQRVYFYKPGIARRCNATADEWGYMQTFFTRLDAAPPPLTLEEAEFAVRVMNGDDRGEVGDACLAIVERAECLEEKPGMRFSEAFFQARAEWLRDYINNRNRKETQ